MEEENDCSRVTIYITNSYEKMFMLRIETFRHSNWTFRTELNIRKETLSRIGIFFALGSNSLMESKIERILKCSVIK